MASYVDINDWPHKRLAAPRRLLAAGIALGLALTAGGAAIWLLSLEHGHPWDDAFADLSSTSEICRAEGDATAHRATSMSRSYGQLDSFVRQRFDQFLTQGKLAQEYYARESQPRATAPPVSVPISEAARLDARLAELVGERGRLLERFTSEHPTIADIEHQIAELDRQRAALPPDVEPVAQQPPIAPKTDASPADRWQTTVQQSIAEYDQLATACRRAEQQFDEAQVAQMTTLDRHQAALERWSESAKAWGKLFSAPAAIGSSLWALAGVSLCLLGWLMARGTVAHALPGADRMITSAAQIERWFSLPTIAVSAADDERSTMHRPASRWLVLPAQFAIAVAVFCLVATTIQNPSWLGHLLAW